MSTNENSNKKDKKKFKGLINKIISVNKIQTISLDNGGEKKDVNLSINQSKNKRGFTFWWRHFTEFLRTTGLHGYKYIAVENEPLIIRIFWAISVIVCLIVAIVLVLSAWNWIQKNPTLTVIESTHYPIWKYPFPAVTLCPLSIIKKSALYNLKTLRMPDNVSLTEITDTLREATVLLGDVEVSSQTVENFKVVQNVLDFNNLTFHQFMEMVRPKCNDLLVRCSWKGSPTRCAALFDEVLSSSGYCCTFNYYALRPTPSEEKKSYFVPKKPRKVAGCGSQTALTALINISPDEFYSTYRGVFGTKVIVHYSFDFSDENAVNKYVDKATESFFAIAPEMTYSTDGIYGYEVKKRRCTFPSEVKLKSFVRYTYLNCLAECRSNFVYEMCGCIPLFLPNNGSRPVCNFTDVICPFKAKNIFYNALPLYKEKKCNCLPDCQQFFYPLELSTGVLVPTNDYNSFSVFKDIKIKNHSLIHVYYNDLVTIRFRKDVYMNWHNVLASFGGILGLFIGFSLVSGFELVYFFTLRVFFDILHTSKDVDDRTKPWDSPGTKKQKIFSNNLNVISISVKESDHKKY